MWLEIMRKLCPLKPHTKIYEAIVREMSYMLDVDEDKETIIQTAIDRGLTYRQSIIEYNRLIKW